MQHSRCHKLQEVPEDHNALRRKTLEGSFAASFEEAEGDGEADAGSSDESTT